MTENLSTELSDGEFAARLAQQAGAILLDIRAAGELAGKALGQAGDEAANAFICNAIRTYRPDDALLSEEEKDNPARCDRSRVWIVDPVDGTREYGEARSDWAVHVGLAVDGAASLGAVALPGLDGGVVLRSDEPRSLPAAPDRPRMVVSRTRPAAEAVAVAELLGAELVPMGSAGAKAMAVVRGEAEIYLHSGGQYEWDNCAPVAVAEAHGLFCSRIDGSPLHYNRRDPYLPDLLICRPEWTGRVFAALGKP
ncbi:3'(2'),5'-bisphosphate nucleotidase CysQ [Erythrobacter litoralis]|nr:3'(2'),5'-bisphosphate nucleotidase CysQ [Erythrobacter litoralis]